MMSILHVNGRKTANFFSATVLSAISAGLVQADTLRPVSQFLIVQATIDAALAAAGVFPDCNENGVDDAQDIADLTSPDCNGNAIPDECEINENSIAPGGPFFCTVECDPDCNRTGVPDECELAGNDCNGDGRPDACGVLVSCDRTEVQKLTASDIASGDFFGQSVSISSDTAIVGAILEGCCGAAYVYRFDGMNWLQDQKLVASDADRWNSFGISVAVSGNTAIVGAYRDECADGEDCGAVYVYHFDGTIWTEEQKLTASDASAQDWFGRSVSTSGGVAVVGAQMDDCAAGRDCGSAYVYRYDGTSWNEEQRLTASDAALEDLFGTSVSISGNTAFVGARSADCAAGSDCGAVYVYRFDGTNWIEQQKLTASDGGNHDEFGISVSHDGDAAVVGAWFANGAAGAGYVYRFDGANWIEQQKLTAFDAAAGDFFGETVSISGDTAVAGARFADCADGSDCGAAYVYRFDGTNWIEQPALKTTDPDRGDFLGTSVSVSGDAVIVGAFRDNCPIDVACGGDCGSAHMFELSASDTNCNGLADRCETDCDGNGMADQFEDLPDADGDTVPDGCDVCPNDDDTIDGDGDGVPDCSEAILSPSLAASPHNVRKNRYISVDPRGPGGFNAGKNFDISVTLFCTRVSGVTAVGSSWWATAPDANCISFVNSTRPATPPNWDACPTLHLTGCPIIPTSTYDIVAVEGGLASFPPLAAETQAKPGIKWHGDCVGAFSGTEWAGPNGQTGIDDAVAAIKTFQKPSNLPGCPAPPCNATHVSMTDVVPNLPGGPQINSIVNIDDVFSIILGFGGQQYPGPQIELCP